MKRLWVLLLPPGQDASLSQGYPYEQQFPGIHSIHLGEERGRGVKFLVSGNSAMTGPGLESPSRRSEAPDTNELDELDSGEHIVEFCSVGPKNYGYATARDKVCCKVKGFSLNSEGSATLNYEVMCQNLLNGLQRPLNAPRVVPVVSPFAIQRMPKSYSLFSRPVVKQYQLVYSKRALDPQTSIT